MNEWTDEESDQRHPFRWLTRSRQMRIVMEHAPLTSHQRKATLPSPAHPVLAHPIRGSATADTITRAHNAYYESLHPRNTMQRPSQGYMSWGVKSRLHPSCKPPYGFDDGQEFRGCIIITF
jgi:hypothetical protein